MKKKHIMLLFSVVAGCVLFGGGRMNVLESQKVSEVKEKCIYSVQIQSNDTYINVGGEVENTIQKVCVNSEEIKMSGMCCMVLYYKKKRKMVSAQLETEFANDKSNNVNMEQKYGILMTAEINEEVSGMCLTEYNEETFVNGIKEEGRVVEIFSSVQDGDYPVSRGAQKLNMDVDAFVKEMEDAGYKIPKNEAINT